MSADVLLEEFEVLEAIYPTELSKISERAVRIDIEPEEPIEEDVPLKVSLEVHYPDDYPDTLPELTLDAIEGELNEKEEKDLLDGLHKAGEENVGMAMTFTLVSLLREQLSVLVKLRAQKKQEEEVEKERLAIEAEEARTRGTPVTIESFKAWKAKFDQEIAAKKSREEDERLKALHAKEREEYKKFATRPSGRQLFERDKNLAISDDNLIEEDAVSVDITQYDRAVVEQEEEEDHVTFSDSD